MSHHLSTSLIQGAFEGIGAWEYSSLRQLAMLPFTRRFFRAMSDFTNQTVALDETEHSLGILMGESMSYIALNLQGLFAVHLAYAMLRGFHRAGYNPSQVDAFLQGISAAWFAQESRFSAGWDLAVFQIGDDQLILLQRDLFLFDRFLKKAYTILGAQTSVGRHLHGPTLCILAEQIAILGPLTHHPIRYIRGMNPSSPWGFEVLSGYFEKADIFKSRLLSCISPVNFIGRVAAMSAVLDYAEGCHPHGSLKTAMTRQRLLSEIRARDSLSMNMIGFTPGRWHLPPCLGGISLPGPSVQEMWDSLDELDVLILRGLRSPDGLLSGVIRFDEDDDWRESHLEMSGVVVDLLAASYSHLGSSDAAPGRLPLYDIFGAAFDSGIDMFSDKRFPDGSLKRKSEHALANELRRRNTHVSVQTYLESLKNSPGREEIRLAEGSFERVPDLNAQSLRTQVDALERSLKARAEKFSRIREWALAHQGELGLTPEIPAWGSIPCAMPTLDSVKSGDGADWHFYRISDLVSAGFPDYLRTPGMKVVLNPPPLMWRDEASWAGALRGYTPQFALSQFLIRS
jgi:hypothetical protein